MMGSFARFAMRKGIFRICLMGSGCRGSGNGEGIARSMVVNSWCITSVPVPIGGSVKKARSAFTCEPSGFLPSW